MSTIWFLASRAWSRKPQRPILIIIAVALGVAITLSTQLTLTALDNQAKQAQLVQAGSSALDIRATAGPGLTKEQIDTIRAIASVETSEPLLEKRLSLSTNANSAQALTATIVAISEHGTSAYRPISVKNGRLPQNGNTKEIAIDVGLAEEISKVTSHVLKTSDQLTLIGATGPQVFEIVGFTSGTSGGANFTKSAIFVSNASVTQIFHLGIHTPLLALHLKPNANISQINKIIQLKFGDSLVTNDPRVSNNEPLRELRSVLLLITILSLIIGTSVIANNVSLNVWERRREIGLLRTAGASVKQIFQLLMLEVGISAIIGGIVGTSIGVIMSKLLTNYYSAGDLSTPSLVFNLPEIFGIIFIGIFTAFLGACIPAFCAGRITPLAATRPMAGGSTKPIPWKVIPLILILVVTALILLFNNSTDLVVLGCILLLAAVICSLPLITPVLSQIIGFIFSGLSIQVPMATRSLAKQRNRITLTNLGLCVGIASAVAISTLSAGSFNASNTWINKLLIGDTMIKSGVTQNDNLVKIFSRAPGVKASSKLRNFSVIVNGNVIGASAIDAAAYQNQNGLSFIEGDSQQAYRDMRNSPAVVLPEQIANSNNLHIGNSILISGELGTVYFTIDGIVQHTFPGGDGRESLVFDSTVAQSYFGKTAEGFDALLLVTDGRSFGNLEALSSQYGLQAISVDDIKQSARDTIGHSIELLLALSVISVLIAMLAIVNTLTISIRQTTRELCLLRAVGMSKQEALRLLMAQASLLGTTGTMLGIGAGLGLAIPITKLSSTSNFAPEFTIPFLTIFLTVIFVIAACLIAAFGPARKVARASIISAVRYE